MVSVEVGASAKKWGHSKPHPTVEVLKEPLQVLKKYTLLHNILKVKNKSYFLFVAKTFAFGKKD